MCRCGRTDTGVHAKQMIAHFDCEKAFNSKNLVSKLNAFLPKDIAIQSIRKVQSKHMQDLMQKKNICL